MAEKKLSKEELEELELTKARKPSTKKELTAKAIAYIKKQAEEASGKPINIPDE